MRKTCFLSVWRLAPALILAACAGEPQPRLYLDLLPLALDGLDPMQGCRSFEVAVEGGPSYEIESFDRHVAFGDIEPGGEARLRARTLDARRAKGPATDFFAKGGRPPRPAPSRSPPV